MMMTTIAAIAMAAAPAPDVKQARGGSYANARYGFSATYPGSLFRLQRESDNGDGATFVSGDGATLLIYGTENPYRQVPRTYLNAQARLESGTITYRRATDGWAVMSGTSGGRTFYQRFEFDRRSGTVRSFRLEYPSRLQGRYGPVVARIALRAGR